TGKRSGDDRTFVVQGFEIKRRHALIFLSGLVPAFFLTLIVWPLLGEYAITVGVLTEVALFVAIEYRTQKGLKLRGYQAIYDKQRAISNDFLICGNRIDPINTTPGWI